MSGPVAATVADTEIPTEGRSSFQTRNRPESKENLFLTIKDGLESQGEPFDTATRVYFESKLGHNFGQIRVHDNTKAAETARKIDADAYSVGNNLMFASGKFKPGTARGNALIAHELAHVIQQSNAAGGSKPNAMELSRRSDPIESEASEVAERVASMSNTIPVVTSTLPSDRIIVTRQHATLQESGMAEAAVADPAESVANAVITELQQDPDDKSGNVRRRLDSFGPPAKQNIMERVETRLAPAQRIQLLAILSRSPPEASPPEIQKMSSKTPQEIAASVGDKSFIQREVSREAGGPNVTAKFMDDGPVVLMPVHEPEPQKQVGKHATSQQLAISKEMVRASKMPSKRSTLEKISTEQIGPPAELLMDKDISLVLEAPEEVEIAERTQPMLRKGPAVLEITDRLNAAAVQDKGQVMEEAAAMKTSIVSKADSEIAKTRGLARRQVAQIRAYFSQQRNNITSYVEQQKNAIRSEALHDTTQLESDSITRAHDFQTQMSQKRTDMTSYVAEQKIQPQSMVEEEISRSNTELETAAGECEQTAENEASRHPGSEDPAPDQRAAARGVGQDSTRDIREKKPTIAQDLRSRLDGFSGEYDQYADTVNSRITETENIVVPAFGEISATSAGLLARDETATLESIESRSSADLQTLSLLETTAVNSVMAKSRITRRQIGETSRLAQGQLDEAVTAIVSEIDAIVAQGSSNIPQEHSLLQETGVPPEEGASGVIDPIEEYIIAERNLALQSLGQLAEAVTTVKDNIPLITTSFAAESVEALKASRAGADNLRQNNAPAIDNLVQARSQQAQSLIVHTRSQQEELATSATSEVDSAAEQARSEVSGINEKFRGELRNGANESIREAIKPRTDRVEDREAEAAERAGESWIVGVFRALGEIIVGLVILVVVALVVAALAAAFGVILTAWGAIMIAGGVLLAVGLIMSIINRSQQKEFREAGLGTQILVVAGDTLGLTNLVEGITGKEVLTGRRLDPSEQARRATIGAFSAVMLALGARGVIKGPRPGFVRSGSLTMPKGWRQAGAGAVEGMKSVGGELYTTARQGVSNLMEWGRRTGERVGLRRLVAPEKPQQQPGETKTDYMQRLSEWSKSKRARERYETASDEAIRQARIEIKDPLNQRWWDQATQREKRLAYDWAREGKVADLGINEARVGLLAERQGVIPGPIRRHQGLGAEFEDVSGVQWDVKSGRTPSSNYVDSLIQSENILVDRSGITDPAGVLDEAGFASLLKSITAELTARGRVDIIGQLGSRVKAVPPITKPPIPIVIPGQKHHDEKTESQ